MAIKASVRKDMRPSSASIFVTTEINAEMQAIEFALERKVLEDAANKFMEERGDELIATIDLQKFGNIITGKIMAAALRKLVEENK